MKIRFTTICFMLLALLVMSPKAQAQTLQAVASQLTSPEQVAKYIFRNFTYETDRTQFGNDERWQTPEELLKNGRGDCEDFAFFASEILKANGISSFLVNVYGNKFAHTVCVFKENGKFHIVDGKEVVRYDASSMEELFSKIYPNWNSASMVGYSEKDNCGRVLKTFQNK